jgi:hypothetical protein
LNRRDRNSWLGAVDWSRARPAFKSISQEFGLVFSDSPPVLATNDALLFAGMVDAVLLVVRVGSANLDEIKRAKELLESIGTPIIGRRAQPVHAEASWPFEPALRRLLPAVAHVSDASALRPIARPPYAMWDFPPFVVNAQSRAGPPAPGSV